MYQVRHKNAPLLMIQKKKKSIVYFVRQYNLILFMLDSIWSRKQNESKIFDLIASSFYLLLTPLFWCLQLFSFFSMEKDADWERTREREWEANKCNIMTTMRTIVIAIQSSIVIFRLTLINTSGHHHHLSDLIPSNVLFNVYHLTNIFKLTLCYWIDFCSSLISRLDKQ